MICSLCPRNCQIDRKAATGVCKMGDDIKIAKHMLHMWEEPCISGENGSGAIFFSGCPLKCVYCQNKEISHSGKGETVSVSRLAEIMLELQAEGAHNINLVTPTHFSDKIRQALELVRGKLHIPVVYNTSGYERVEEIEKMRGYVDVFLCDVKYFGKEYSKKYSSCPDYYEVFKRAFEKMLELCPEVIFDNSGIIKSGVILRHLVLPSLRHDSINILKDIASSFDVSAFKLSLMSQYTPEFLGEGYLELNRKITTFEYSSVLECAVSLDYDGYIQEKSSATSKYTPKF